MWFAADKGGSGDVKLNTISKSIEVIILRYC